MRSALAPDKPLTTRSHGLIFVGFSLILVVVTTIAMLISSGINLSDQRLTANDARVIQAFESAEAGLSRAIGMILNSPPPYSGFAGALPNLATYEVELTDVSEGNGSAISITALGRSVDRLGRRVIRQTLIRQQLISHTPRFPMIVRGQIRMQGNSTINNSEGTSTIWAGGLFNESIWNSGNSGGTYVNINDGGPLVHSTKGNTNGPDVIPFDPSLFHSSPDDFFYNFFGTTRPILEETARTNPAVLWLSDPSGTYRINGNDVYGSPTEPVIIFVDGNLLITGSPTFYGMIYIAGDFSRAGNAEINGTVVVEGTADLQGNLEINYDSFLIDSLRSIVFVGSLPGSWRDF